MDMTLILGGVILPKYSSLKRIDTPNESDNFTLASTLYTDFINNHRSWLITWKDTTRANLNIVRNLYLEQYTNGTYHPLQFDAENIYAPVKINISDQDVKFNGELVTFQATITEQYAFS